MAGRNFHVGAEGVQTLQFEITPATGPISPRPVKLWVQGEGTFTIVDEAGNELTYNVGAEGQIFPFSPVELTATDGDTVVYGWGLAENVN